MTKADNDGSQGTPPGGGRGRLLAILLLVAAAVAGVAWMAQQMRDASRVQDCMMAGRTNCASAQ